MATGAEKVKRQKLDDDGPSTSAFANRSVHELMPSYYAKLFPHQHMYKWLAYGNDSRHPHADPHFFNRREFCFTLDGDIFVRYQAFKDGDALANAIRAKCPAKIDIGPVYTANPQERLKFGASFQPVERELVFDIDLTDYDNVRTCGQGGHICTKCWPLMSVAIKIIDAGLREEFGFRHILWVYSGRRGVHCWVCDASARQLTDEQRASIANWFAVYKGHEEGKARIALTGSTLHPAVQRAASILREAWTTQILPAQRLLEDGPACDALLKYLPEEKLVEDIKREWAAAERKSARSGSALDPNEQRWRILVEKVEGRVVEEESRKGAKNFRVLGPLQKAVDEIIMAHAYPRLDMEVSKKMNHLLKAPFCVHPKTGKVCVPIEPEHADDFDPETVPSVRSLLEELAAAGQQQQQPQGEAMEVDAAQQQQEQQQRNPVADKEPWRRTSMAGAVQLFERCLLAGLEAANKEELLTRTRVAVAVNQLSLDY